MSQLARAYPSINILIGVGGAFEMIAGQKPRSPVWMRRIGLEWLWRVIIEPKRLRRIVNASIVFPVLVAKEAFQTQGVIRPVHRVFSEVFKQLRGL
jgi:UDP-N-acetyl-D-mannosaminuronic acid transferase (WecB/TagA/CpsF family)